MVWGKGCGQIEIIGHVNLILYYLIMTCRVLIKLMPYFM